MDLARLDRLRARIREADVAAAVLVHPPNLRYLVGFHSNAYSRPLALVVPADGDPTLLVPRLEELQAREMTRVADVRSYVEWDEGSAAGGRLDGEWLALLTGVLTDPRQHPVPVTPEEMAREAKAAFDAGASIMHVHFRNQTPGKGHLPSCNKHGKGPAWSWDLWAGPLAAEQ